MYCSYDIDLLGFLDYEIWNASHMLTQHIPLSKDTYNPDKGWEDFGHCWKDDLKEKASNHKQEAYYDMVRVVRNSVWTAV